jgi:hypothetical protein
LLNEHDRKINESEEPHGPSSFKGMVLVSFDPHDILDEKYTFARVLPRCNEATTGFS